MSSLKDKAIKWLGGFTADEMKTIEALKIKRLLQEPCYGRERLKTVKLCSNWWIWKDERIPEHHLLQILAEGLTKEIEKYIEIEVSSDELKRIYKGEIEIVVREGAE